MDDREKRQFFLALVALVALVVIYQGYQRMTRPASSEPRNGIIYHDDAKEKTDTLTEEIKASPTAAKYVERGEEQFNRGLYSEALKDLKEGERLAEKSGADSGLQARIHFIRGKIYMRQDHPKRMLAEYEKSIALQPNNSEACNDLAWTLATHRNTTLHDGAKALKYAKMACEQTDWNEAAYIDTLAAAHARVGQFDQAVKYQRQAIDTLPKDSPWTSEFQSRLKRYEDHMAYVEQ